MKSRILRSMFCALVLTMIALVLFGAPRSSADPTSVHSNQDEKGTIVAQLKEYDPTVEGYGFRNYGRDHDNESDLGPGDLIKIFGAENVCESGTTPSDCVLYEPAEEWLDQQFKMLANGHCDGLAMTSLRFWLGLPFEGRSTPSDWQSGAHKVSDLQHTDAICRP